MRSTMTAYFGGSSSALPPSVAISARTPTCRPRRFTSLRKGAGNVFSMPTSNPTTASDTGAQHLLPVGPVVRPAVPHLEMRVDVLAPQRLAERDGLARIHVVAT